MFDGLAALAHGLRVLVEALLDGLQHMLMLPARDPSLLAGRAARLKHTVAARVGPIAPQLLPVLFVRAVVLQLFASRAAINILVAEIDKILLAEATLGLNARGQRFRKRHGDAGLVTRQNLIAVEVATVGNGLEFIDAESFLGLASDVGELRSI